jgi:hypothetical protein
LLLFALAPWLETATPASRRVFLAFVILGAITQAVGLATSFLEDQYSTRYYDSHFNYRMSHAPLISQSALLYRYARAASRGEPVAPLGKGFDRWFVFLSKAGVDRPPVFLLLSISTVVAAAAGLKLARDPRLRAPLPGSSIAQTASSTLK